MKITDFQIQNFKGIKNAKLKLGKQTAPIHTLVGLNESGKTTILEAINAFRPDLDGMHVLAQKGLCCTNQLTAGASLSQDRPIPRPS
jgi:recombinational DNA repair ATPase RecF